MDELESRNPTTGGLVGSVLSTPADGVEAIVEEVAHVQPVWAQLGLGDRGRYMRRTAQAIIDLTDEIVALIVREQGKPRAEAYLMEVLPTIDALHWMADRGPSILADEKIPTPQLFLKTKRSSFTYDPLGVVAVIAPWNFPWTVPLQEVAMALMAGNGVVLKPASLTPLTGELIAEVFARAGVPRESFGSCTGPGQARRSCARRASRRSSSPARWRRGAASAWRARGR